METKDILDHLEKLAQLDIDACHAYDQAIQRIDDQLIKDKLILFQGDHRRHVDTLSAKIREYGGTPPEFSKDFKGFFISGFTALRSMMGNKGALEAMETNERLTTSNYEKAVNLEWPAELSAVIRSHYADEQRHLSFVREALQRERNVKH